MTLTIPTFSLASIGPWLTLSGAAILILMWDALSKERPAYIPHVALAALLLAGFQSVGLWGKATTDFARMVYVDNVALFFYHPDAPPGLGFPPRFSRAPADPRP